MSPVRLDPLRARLRRMTFRPDSDLGPLWLAPAACCGEFKSRPAVCVYALSSRGLSAAETECRCRCYSRYHHRQQNSSSSYLTPCVFHTDEIKKTKKNVWSLVWFVASEFLTTICHLAIVNVCVIIILCIGNTQISILLLSPCTYLLNL